MYIIYMYVYIHKTVNEYWCKQIFVGTSHILQVGVDAAAVAAGEIWVEYRLWEV